MVCIFLLFSLCGANAASKATKISAFDDLAGVWRGKVQFLNHNTRYEKPKTYQISWVVLSIDKTGNVIGRSENECAINGTITPFQQKGPARLDVVVYRCLDPEMNRRFEGFLNKRGEFVMSWQMQDEIYPVIIRMTGLMSLDEK